MSEVPEALAAQVGEAYQEVFSEEDKIIRAHTIRFATRLITSSVTTVSALAAYAIKQPEVATALALTGMVSGAAAPRHLVRAARYKGDSLKHRLWIMDVAESNTDKATDLSVWYPSNE